MKFKAGDLVWVMDSPNGELPEVIKAVSKEFYCADHQCAMYHIQGYAPVCEVILRPRRDDYQQHERLGSIETVRSLMKKEGSLVLA